MVPKCLKFRLQHDWNDIMVGQSRTNGTVKSTTGVLINHRLKGFKMLLSVSGRFKGGNSDQSTTISIAKTLASLFRIEFVAITALDISHSLILIIVICHNMSLLAVWHGFNPYGSRAQASESHRLQILKAPISWYDSFVAARACNWQLLQSGDASSWRTWAGQLAKPSFTCWHKFVFEWLRQHLIGRMELKWPWLVGFNEFRYIHIYIYLE